MQEDGELLLELEDDVPMLDGLLLEHAPGPRLMHTNGTCDAGIAPELLLEVEEEVLGVDAQAVLVV